MCCRNNLDQRVHGEANLEDSWPAEVRMTMKLALAPAKELAFDGVLERTLPTIRFTLRGADRRIRFYITCFKNGVSIISLALQGAPAV